MAALTSKREVLMDYLVNNTLPLINEEGNYNHSIKTITRQAKMPNEFDVPDLPAIVIRDDFKTMYTPMTGNGYTTGNAIEDVTQGMIIMLMGINSVKDAPVNDNTGVISQASNLMLIDMILAMLTDESLGGNCLQVTLLSSQNALDWAGQNKAVTFQVYSIKYDWNPTTPVI